MLTKSDISQIRTVVKEEVGGQLKPIDKRLRKVEKKLDLTITLFDRDYIKLKKRVDKIEDQVFA